MNYDNLRVIINTTISLKKINNYHICAKKPLFFPWSYGLWCNNLVHYIVKEWYHILLNYLDDLLFIFK